MKIGITINVGKSTIWSNGVNQNAIYLGMLFKKGGHEPYLIYGKSETNKTEDQLNSIPSGVKCIELNDSYKESFDVILQVGLSIEKYMENEWRGVNKNLKIVGYECGNHFFIDSEKILYNMHNPKSNPNAHINRIKIDQLWVIPQMENTCLNYFQFIKRCDDATVVPFTWNPIAIETYFKERDLEQYTPRELRKIAVMEPNLSMMKNCIYPIVHLENYINNHEHNLEKILLVGAQRIKDNGEFKNLIRGTNLLKNNLLSAETRIKTGTMLAKYCDIVFSWQWENNLNYLYFDVAWNGWPIIHNANLCQDIGYYYEIFNNESANEALNNVFNNHNDDKDYRDRMRKNISRYTVENNNLISDYNMLLDDLVNGKFTKRKYDWKTNSIS